MGRDDCSLGSGKPNNNCIFLMAARYDLIVWGDGPPSAIIAEKQQSTCSVTGNGSRTWYCLAEGMELLHCRIVGPSCRWGETVLKISLN